MTPWWRSALAGVLRLALILLPIAVDLAVIGGLGWAWWWSSLGEYRNTFTFPITILTLVLLGAVVTSVSDVRSLRPRPVTDAVELAEDIQPALWAAVRTVAAAVDEAPPERLYLGLDPTQVSLMTRTGRLGRRRRVLVLGVAPLCALSPQQWRAALTQALLMEQSGPSRERGLLRGQRWMTAVESSAPRARWVRWTRSLLFRAHAWLALPGSAPRAAPGTCARILDQAEVRQA